MPGNNTQWPESYGFIIAGNGPCYVISVQRDGVAHKANIMPGDQLLEVDGHNVTDMSSEAIRTLARHSRTSPPTVGVVSRLQYVELMANRRWGYGFTLKGIRPTYVDSVDPPGPAYQAGVRPGDIILEINGKKIRNLDLFRPLLNTRYGRVTLAVIPVENKNTSRMHGGQIRTEGSRVRKAKDLFAKMNMVLGADYERKMAVVGLMKTYAEDRKVDTFAGGLNQVLTSTEHRKLIRELRPFVPVKHRAQFDGSLHHDPLLPTSTVSRDQKMAYLSPQQVTAVKEGRPREIIVDREGSGSFGFVLRGHDPVYVESITPGGAAERAGMLPGDAILKLNGLDVRKSSHSHMVKLLQGSGGAPRMQIRQMVDDRGVPVYYQDNEISDESSASSHISSAGWLAEDSQLVDRSGRTFRDRVDHLMAAREKSAFRKALINYNVNRNVRKLVDELSVILDAPSKKTLWGFILPRMTVEHRDYILRHVDFPQHQIQEILGGTPLQSNDNSLQRSVYSDRSGVSAASGFTWEKSVPDDPRMGSFRQQLEYLLTSRERSQLKKALQIYAEKRNIQNLLEDLTAILDSPSKRTLWFYIIPLLSPSHQQYCQRQLGLPEHIIKSKTPNNNTSNGRLNGFKTLAGTGNVEGPAKPLKGDVMYQHENNMRDQASLILHRDPGELSDDEADSSDAAPRRKREIDRGTRRSRSAGREPSSSRSDGTSTDRSPHTPRHILKDSELATISLRPEYVDQKGKEMLLAAVPPPVKLMKETSCQTTPRNSFRDNQTDYKTIVRVYDASARRADIIEVQSSTVGANKNGNHINGHKDRDEHGQIDKIDNLQPHSGSHTTNGHGPYSQEMPIYATVQPRKNGKIIAKENMKFPVNGMAMSSDAESDSTQKNSVNSYESFQRKAMKAIKALDEVVANEPSDIDSASIINMHGGYISEPVKKNERPFSPPIMAPEVPCAPPPPPPPPVPPAPPPPSLSSTGSRPPSMHVKRMNWEKIDVIEENMVWAKIGTDSEDLDDIVKYLELEQQFSTKKNKISESFRDRKTEMCILNPKKAYNISILLGHMKKSVEELKDSLYRMDGSVLNAEILRQILSFVPDTQEIDKYDSHKGSIEQLSKPDQFMYKLSRVPGYQERMKAMLFKENFAEKVDEVKKNLYFIKRASQELQQSRKLAKILELVLAMGNYLNKGNQRVGGAVAFKISFLAQLELTKTTDNRGTFLNVLADAIRSKYPEHLPLSQDLPSVRPASHVSSDLIDQELIDLRKVLQEISTTVEKLKDQKSGSDNDRFDDIMGHFISSASDEMQTLFSLQTAAIQEFNSLLLYFGEDPTNAKTADIFHTFAEFIRKFEKAHMENMQQRRHYGRIHNLGQPHSGHGASKS